MTARELLLDHDEKFIMKWIDEHQFSETFDLDIPVFKKDLIIQKRGRGYLLVHSTSVRSIRVRDDYKLLTLPTARLNNKVADIMELDLFIVDLRNGQLMCIKPLNRRG